MKNSKTAAYQEIILLKHKRNNLFFALSLISICGLFVFCASFLLTNVFPTNILFSFPFHSVTFNARSFYAVSLEEFLTEADANTYARSVKQKGAAGYVINGSIYRVLASVYDNIDDASVVKDGLITSGYQAEVITIPLLEKRVSGLNSLERVDLMNIYESLLDCYKELYDLSVALDIRKKDSKAVRLGVQTMLSGMLKLKSGLHASANKVILAAKEHLDNTIDLLNHLDINLVVDSEVIPYTAEIKSAYVKIVYYYITFCNL